MGIVKYSFLVITLGFFFSPQEIYLQEKLFFSEFAFRLNSSPTANVNDGRWWSMQGIWSREKMFCVCPFFWPTLHVPVINCERELCIFLQAHGLKSTSGKIRFLVLYRSAGKAMVWQSRRTWLKMEIKFWCRRTIGKWGLWGDGLILVKSGAVPRKIWLRWNAGEN